MDIKRKN